MKRKKSVVYYLLFFDLASDRTLKCCTYPYSLGHWVVVGRLIPLSVRCGASGIVHRFSLYPFSFITERGSAWGLVFCFDYTTSFLVSG